MNTSTSSTPLAEQDARIDRALVTAFLETVPDFVYFKDRQSHFIAVSDSVVRYFGRSRPEEVMGRTDADFFAAALSEAALADERRIMDTGEPMLGKMEKLTWPDGHETWVSSSKLPLRDADGQIIGTFGISKDVTESRRMEQELDRTRKNLVDASHMAGMAEVATGVLHNVGNVLNSVNVSASMIGNSVRQGKVESLGRVAAMIREHGADLGKFLTEDPRGKLVPDFIDSVARHAAGERERLLKELESLQKNIDHIKDIVNMQQAYATMVGVTEPLDMTVLLEDSLRMNSGALVRHDVRVVREFQPVPPVLAEKGKVLQILVNLIRNAKHACDAAGQTEKVIILRVEMAASDRVRISVQDNGEGIPAENLTRIFAHGFTTRRNGHGFGLHSSALAAKEMKGTLNASSEGRGHGALFTLELPATGS